MARKKPDPLVMHTAAMNKVMNEAAAAGQLRQPSGSGDLALLEWLIAERLESERK